SAPLPTGEQLKPEKRKAIAAKDVEKENAVIDKIVDEELKPKMEKLVIAKEGTAGPVKKTEEVKLAPQEKVAEALAMEQVKEEGQQDLKVASVGRATKKVKSEALSGAGLPGKVGI